MLGGATTWHLERITPDLAQWSSVRNVLYAGRSQYQEVEVLETASFGRCLVLDGKTQSSEADRPASSTPSGLKSSRSSRASRTRISVAGTRRNWHEAGLRKRGVSKRSSTIPSRLGL